MTENLSIPAPDDSGEFVLYQAEDGRTRIEVRMAHETVWLTQRDMAELFQTTPQNVTQHIAAIYDEGELSEAATCKDFLQVRSEASRQVQRSLKHYNLDVIISVGYRVRSHRGTQFRIWAKTKFEEGGEKCENRFTRKNFRVCQTDRKSLSGTRPESGRWPNIGTTIDSFWNINRSQCRRRPSQSKPRRFHVEVFHRLQGSSRDALLVAYSCRHRSTARRTARADYTGMPRTDCNSDQYCQENTSAQRRMTLSFHPSLFALHPSVDELEALNRIVTAYLEFAELQALNRKPMYMADWIGKLDDFLRLSDRQILPHAGKISHDDAVEKAEAEFALLKQQQAALPQAVDEHFTQSLDELKKIETQAKAAEKESPGKKTPKKKAAKKPNGKKCSND